MKAEARNEQLSAQSISQLATILELQEKTCALQAALLGAQAALAKEETRCREAEAAIRELQDAKAAAEALSILAAAQTAEAAKRATLANERTTAALLSLAKASAVEEMVGEKAKEMALKEVVAASGPKEILVGENSGTSSSNSLSAKNPARSITLQDSAISLEIPSTGGGREEVVVLAKKGGNNRARRREKRMAQEKFRGDVPKEADPPIKMVPKIGPVQASCEGKKDANRVVDPITLIPKGYRIDYFEYDPKLPMEKYIVQL